MRKKLLFVLAAVFLTAMIFSTVSAVGPGPNPNPDAGPCTCEDDVRIDENLDGICDICLHCIPLEDGSGNDDD